MIKFRSRKELKLERLNLVPIMDAVFIFIFFLLFSAQFIKIFEIETHAPIVSKISNDKKLEKDPLNLTLQVEKNTVEVKTGLDLTTQFKLFLDEKNALNELKAKMIALRQKFPSDDEAIVSPSSSVRYDVIIKIIDAIQFIPKGQKILIQKDGKEVNLNKIFSKVVLEPL